MADDITADETEFDADGKPILKEEEAKKPEEVEGEGGEVSPPEKKETEEEVGEVPVRTSAQQHIIARQKRTIEKLRSKAEEDEMYQPSEKAEEEEDYLDPQVKSAVDRQIQRRLDPILGTLASRADDDELSTLFLQEPSAKKYEKRIKAHMDVWKNVPAKSIYQSLAFADAQAIGTKRKQVADMEAGQMKSGGRSVRPTGGRKKGGLPTAEEINEMSEEDFEGLLHKAQTGAFLS